MPRDNKCMYNAHVCFMSVVLTVCGFVGMFVVSFFILKSVVVCLCKGCDGCCVLCWYCDMWSCRCSCMESMSVLTCRCCMFVSCVHPVAVLNAAFCMTCSLLMLVEDAMSVSFCLPQPVTVSAFIICSGLC